MVAQFTVKKKNSKFTVYFSSLMSCSISRQKSQKFYVFRINVENNFLLQEMMGGGGGGGCRRVDLCPPCPALLSLQPWYSPKFYFNYSFWFLVVNIICILCTHYYRKKVRWCCLFIHVYLFIFGKVWITCFRSSRQKVFCEVGVLFSKLSSFK